MLLGQELSKSSPAVPPGLIYKICISSHAYHHTRPLLTKPSLRLTYLKSFPPPAAETGSLSVCPRKSIPAGFNLLHSHPLQLSVKQISNSTYSSSSVYKKFITASLYCQVFFCFFFFKILSGLKILSKPLNCFLFFPVLSCKHLESISVISQIFPFFLYALFF